MAAFKGWPVEAIEFFEGLEADNSKTYWLERKGVYESSVKAPMEALLAELAGEFGEAHLFRPYRDVRFSKDKSPYKTNIAATVGERGYVSLSAEALGAGSGMYMMAPDQLERYRAAVDSPGSGAELERLVAGLRGRGASVESHDALKTVPKGYPKDHPRADLLRGKGLISWQQWSVGEWLGTSEARKRVVSFLRASRPLCEWLDGHVGPTTLDGHGRHGRSR